MGVPLKTDRRIAANDCMNIVVFFLLITGTSFGAHHFLKNSLLLASFLSAVMAAILFQLIGYFVQGYLDPFAIIAFFVSFTVNFFISIAIGYALRCAKK